MTSPVTTGDRFSWMADGAAVCEIGSGRQAMSIVGRLRRVTLM